MYIYRVILLDCKVSCALLSAPAAACLLRVSRVEGAKGLGLRVLGDLFSRLQGNMALSCFTISHIRATHRHAAMPMQLRRSQGPRQNAAPLLNMRRYLG